MLRGVAEPGAEDVFFLLPQHGAGACIKHDDAVILWQIPTAPRQQALGMRGEFVEAVDASTACDDTVVQKAVPRFHTPEKLAAVPLKHRETRAR